MKNIYKAIPSNTPIKIFWIFLSVALLLLTLARIAYSGWFSPLAIFHMRGDGITGIFSGIDGYFMPGPLRAMTVTVLNHPYISITFYYSIFHSLCMTEFLGVALIAAAHICMILVILLSLGIFELPRRGKIFALLLFVAIFNWAPFYDGVLQGFPAEFIEVFGVILGFWLFLKGAPVSAGAVLGLASTVKVLPVIFLIYFAYKRQFRLVTSAVIAGIILCAIILWKENFNPNVVTSMIDSMGVRGAYAHNTRDPGLSAFMDFIFHFTLTPDTLIKIHYGACLFLILFFIAVERRIGSFKDQYLFGLAAVSLAMSQIAPRISEMYWYVLLLPVLIFNIWLLIRYPNWIFGVIFTLSYIFMHGFSLLNIFFRLRSDLYLFFNEHGGVFIGIWLLYFSTYGLALKYLIGKKEVL